MSSIYETLYRTLKEHGYSLTKPRQAVFEALVDTEPQSMAEIIEATQGLLDRASVYRIIALFERLGIVNRIQMGWKYKLELSDSFSYHHHHATCLRCGRIVTLPENNDLEQKIQILALINGFIIKDHQLEIRGLCPKCQALTFKGAPDEPELSGSLTLPF